MAGCDSGARVWAWSIPLGGLKLSQGFAGGEHVVIAPGKLADLKNEGRRVTAAAKTSDAIASNKLP